MADRSEIDGQEQVPAALAWTGLGAVYLGFVAFGLVFQFLPPLLPVLMEELGVTHGPAGLLMSVFALPGVVLSIPGGQLVDRFGPRAVGTWGLALLAAGTVAMTVAPGFGGLLTARGLAGAGGMVAVVTLQRAVTRLFAGRAIGLPMGIATTAIPLGIILGLNLAGPLAADRGWRFVAAGAAAAAALAAVAYSATLTLLRRRVGPPPARAADGGAPAGSGGWFGAPGALWLVGMVWLCANGAMTGFVTFAPDFLTGLGLSLTGRGFLTSLPMLGSALLGPLVGWIVDRRGGRADFMAAGMALMALLLALIPGGGLPPAAVAAGLGVAMAGIVTPVLSSPAELLPPHRHGRAFGVLSALANVGIFGIPPLAGRVRTLSGGYLAPFLLMAAVAAVGVVIARLARARLHDARGP
jgi:MFS family permease